MIDLFTGCFDGGVWVCEGKGDGAFRSPRSLLDQDGRILRLGQYWDDAEGEWTGVEGSPNKEALGIGVVAVDWDADGDLDLLLGSNEGGLYLRKNAGSKDAPTFELDSEPLSAGDAPIAVPRGHLIPAIADWDGDGRFDLFSGSGAGGVWWWRNVGMPGAPAFERERRLLADAKRDDSIIDPASPYVEGQKWEHHGYVWLVERKLAAPKPAAKGE